MTGQADFRDRLEALLGPVNTISRAAAALGCDRRSIYRWLDPEYPEEVPDRAIRDLQALEAAVRNDQARTIPWVAKWLAENPDYDMMQPPPP